LSLVENKSVGFSRLRQEKRQPAKGTSDAECRKRHFQPVDVRYSAPIAFASGTPDSDGSASDRPSTETSTTAPGVTKSQA